VQAASEPGVAIEPKGAGWTRAAEGEAMTSASSAALGEAGAPVRFVLVSDVPEPTPLALLATAEPLAALPPLVASRLWLRTVQGPEYDLRTLAVYLVESHERALDVALPPGAEWIRARVAGTIVSQVEQLPKGAGYRVPFPERIASGPVIVTLEYAVPPAHAAGAWSPPRLVGSGLVQQTRWEVRVPWVRAVVGVPAGWTDENQWRWDTYAFRRRPAPDPAALAAWAAGSKERAGLIEGLEDALSSGDQTYLFSRPGAPAALSVLIASRGILLGVCSGTVLVLGAVLILYWRPSFRPAWLVALALCLACATLVQSSVTLLVVQSAAIGIGLTILTALMQWVAERGRGVARFGDTSGLTAPIPPGSSRERALSVGSDDSTQIRVRPISSTSDHPVAGNASAASAEPSSAGGRSRGPAEPNRR
jgi:hypothetical protein